MIRKVVEKLKDVLESLGQRVTAVWWALHFDHLLLVSGYAAVILAFLALAPILSLFVFPTNTSVGDVLVERVVDQVVPPPTPTPTPVPTPAPVVIVQAPEEALEESYYRGIYDICMYAVEGRIPDLNLRSRYCNEAVVTDLKSEDWFGQPSEGFIWPPKEKDASE